MKYGSVCSGLGTDALAWAELGWSPAWFSEIKPFACRVLNHYHPDVPNLGDMNQIPVNHKQIKDYGPIELLVGGTPCQSFSLAGLRGGLDDPRGNLALVYIGILERFKPRWFIWENVAGVLSSRTNGVNDFDTFIAGIKEVGYSLAWRVLDAQYFGVAQTRRRVFVVGHIGDDWRPPAAVLFEPQGLYRDIRARRQKRKGITGGVEAGASTSYRWLNKKDGLVEDVKTGTITGNTSTHERSMPAVIVNAEGKTGFPTLTARNGHLNNQTPLVVNQAQITSPTNRSKPVPGDPSPTITGKGQVHILFSFQNRICERNAGMPLNMSRCLSTDPTDIQASNVWDGNRVRRLTPLEYERLMGFPDHYTAIPGAKDTPRYNAIGEAIAVPVLKWIGRRIKLFDDVKKGLIG